MKRDGYRTISGLLFGLVALAQGVRAALQLPAQVGSTGIPIWISWVAAVVTGSLCVWAFRPSGE
jgi:hypothetical protein